MEQFLNKVKTDLQSRYAIKYDPVFINVISETKDKENILLVFTDGLYIDKFTIKPTDLNSLKQFSIRFLNGTMKKLDTENVLKDKKIAFFGYTFIDDLVYETQAVFMNYKLISENQVLKKYAEKKYYN